MSTDVIEPQRRTPVLRDTDVVVLSGGPAGIAAATCAARHGARVTLVERYGFLGGMGTAAMVTNFCGLHVMRGDRFERVVRGVADDILATLERLDGLGPVRPVLGRTAAQCYDNAVYKCAADELVRRAGVDVLFHTLAVGVLGDAGKIDTLFIETKSGRAALRARVFVDCSGDADLVTWAGLPVEKGGEHGELAYPTMMFRIGNVDDALAVTGKARLRELMDAAEANGEMTFPRRAAWINPQPHAREWRANVTQIAREGRAVDGTDHADLSFGEQEGRLQAIQFFSFLKRRVPGFADSYLLELAPQVGIRETRRIGALHQLTKDEVLGATDFEDAIGVNPWPLEQHVLGDVKWQFLEGRGYCQIPFRSLLPRGTRNVLAAGRCAGATHEAQSSLRVSGPCFVMGQAAGTAAAMAAREGIDVPAVDVGELRARLARDGVFFG